MLRGGEERRGGEGRGGEGRGGEGRGGEGRGGEGRGGEGRRGEERRGEERRGEERRGEERRGEERRGEERRGEGRGGERRGDEKRRCVCAHTSSGRLCSSERYPFPQRCELKSPTSAVCIQTKQTSNLYTTTLARHKARPSYSECIPCTVRATKRVTFALEHSNLQKHQKMILLQGSYGSVGMQCSHLSIPTLYPTTLHRSSVRGQKLDQMPAVQSDLTVNQRIWQKFEILVGGLVSPERLTCSAGGPV